MSLLELLTVLPVWTTLASFLIPWESSLHCSGGLQAFLLFTPSSFMLRFDHHDFPVYVKFYSSDQIHEFLNATTSYTNRVQVREYLLRPSH
jgi:hypothetical protein